MFNCRTIEGLLNFSFSCRIKEKFPYAFDDICLYSEVSHLLAHCMFRLTSRRFIQELFQDVQFMPVRHYTTRSPTFSETLSLRLISHVLHSPFLFVRCMRKQRQSWQSYQNLLKRILTLLQNPDHPPPRVPCTAPRSCHPTNMGKKRLREYKIRL